MILQILLRHINFGSFSLGRCEENYPRSIYPGGYIPDNGDSYPRLPSDVDQVVQFFCSHILVLLLLPMWINYFNGCPHARSLDIAAQTKLWENLHWYLQVYGLVFILGCLQKSTRLYHGRRKNLKTSKIC
jgi:hypothetical protein